MLSSRPGEHVRISSLPAQFCRTKTNCSPSQCNEASPSSKCSPGGQSAARNNRRQVRVSAFAVYCPCPSQIIRISSGGNSSILDMLYYLEKNSASCTLTELAERFGYHPKYVTALFKQMTGLSFKQLQIRERMKHAAALLEKTDASIQEIAQQTGAGNLSAFYKDFQRQYGMLPSVWRRLHRADVKFQARSGTAANI